MPPIDGSEYPANTPSDLQKQLCDRNDVIQNSRNPITPSMQDVEHPSSWRRLIVLFPAGQSQRTLKNEAKTAWNEGVWTEEHQRAFETLKGALLCRPVLALPRKDRHWRLATDASNVAMGAVLSQHDDDNVEHPVGYYSRKLIDPSLEKSWRSY